MSRAGVSRVIERKLRRAREMDSRDALRAVHHAPGEFASILGFRGRREMHSPKYAVTGERKWKLETRRKSIRVSEKIGARRADKVMAKILSGAGTDNRIDISFRSVERASPVAARNGRWIVIRTSPELIFFAACATFKT